MSKPTALRWGKNLSQISGSSRKEVGDATEGAPSKLFAGAEPQLHGEWQLSDPCSGFRGEPGHLAGWAAGGSEAGVTHILPASTATQHQGGAEHPAGPAQAHFGQTVVHLDARPLLGSNPASPLRQPAALPSAHRGAQPPFASPLVPPGKAGAAQQHPHHTANLPSPSSSEVGAGGGPRMLRAWGCVCGQGGPPCVLGH